jgi:regulator of protease activity HflC (stomatin/prohibitin superfamily)
MALAGSRSLLLAARRLQAGPFRAVLGATSGYRTGGNHARMPVNMGINFVPQQEAWVVERFGKFHEILEPGLRLLIPVVDTIKYVHTLKEMVVEIPSQSAITEDNVTLHLDGVLYLRVNDPYKVSYGVENPVYLVSQLAQTTMRSELGKLSLDNVFRERASLNELIVAAINDASATWGMKCLRCEIRDIMLPDRVVDDMQRQVSAERKKRASILESEGQRAAAINVANGQKEAAILASEGFRLQQTNSAIGEAEAIRVRAEALATAIDRVAAAVQKPGGHEAVTLQVAEQYIEAFAQLAQKSTTLLLPANVSEPSAMIAQAMSIFSKLSKGDPRSTAEALLAPSILVNSSTADTSTSSSSPSHTNSSTR